MVGLNGNALPDQDFNYREFNQSHTSLAAKDPPPRRARSSQTSRGPKPLLPRSLKEALQLAELLSKSKLIPKGFETPETCLVGILYGMEVGLSPIAALQRMAVIDGRPTIWGDAALALVQASGLLQSIEEEIVEKDDPDHRKILTAICKVKREGRLEPTLGAFSIEDAKRAGLWQKPGPWTDYPKRMLTMRARAFALRDAFPDVLAGLYIREEFDGAEKRQSTSSQERPIRDDADWNAIADQQSKSSSVLRRAPPPPPDPVQEIEKRVATEGIPISQIEKTDRPHTPQTPLEISGVDQDKQEPENHIDPETLLDLLDSALCCALNLPTLAEIVDDFAKRLEALEKDHQKRAQKIIARHHSRVEVLDHSSIASLDARDAYERSAAKLPRGLKSLLPRLGLGQSPSGRRSERGGVRLHRQLASWNARQPLINHHKDQPDEDIVSSGNQTPEVNE